MKINSRGDVIGRSREIMSRAAVRVDVDEPRREIIVPDVDDIADWFGGQRNYFPVVCVQITVGKSVRRDDPAAFYACHKSAALSGSR